MPRVYKPIGKIRYKKHDIQKINKALQELTSKDVSLKTVAQKYGISKAALYRYTTNIVRRPGGQIALPLEVEKVIVENINMVADSGYPIDRTDLRYLVKIYLDTHGMVHKKFKNNLPGIEYIFGFVKRHKDEIFHRLQRQKRSKNVISPEIKKIYFQESQKSIDNHSPVITEDIIDYDEICFANLQLSAENGDSLLKQLIDMRYGSKHAKASTKESQLEVVSEKNVDRTNDAIMPGASIYNSNKLDKQKKGIGKKSKMHNQSYEIRKQKVYNTSNNHIEKKVFDKRTTINAVDIYDKGNNKTDDEKWAEKQYEDGSLVDIMVENVTNIEYEHDGNDLEIEYREEVIIQRSDGLKKKYKKKTDGIVKLDYKTYLSSPKKVKNSQCNQQNSFDSEREILILITD